MGRGLSPVQNEIMQVARRQGFITPYDARECAWRNVSLDDTSRSFAATNAVAAAIASRSLRRLVARGLLVYERRRFLRQSNVYRLTGWYGCLPWLKQPTLANFHERMDAELNDIAASMARAAGAAGQS
jgi:hypothetical protein